MNPHYNQNYKIEQIEETSNTIHDCIKKGHYTISRNEKRKENIEFIQYYNLKSNKQRDILLQIKPKDFCHSLNNTNPGFEHEVLYVFCPQVSLLSFDGEEEVVDIYIKFNIIEYGNGKRVITISFHKRNKPIDYLFRY